MVLDPIFDFFSLKEKGWQIFTTQRSLMKEKDGFSANLRGKTTVGRTSLLTPRKKFEHWGTPENI